MLYLDLAYPLSLDGVYPLAYRIRDHIVESFARTPKKFLIVFVLSWAAMLFAYFETRSDENDPEV